MTQPEYDAVLSTQLGIARLQSLLTVLIDTFDDDRQADAIELCADYAHGLQKQISGIPGFHAASLGRFGEGTGND